MTCSAFAWGRHLLYICVLAALATALLVAEPGYAAKQRKPGPVKVKVAGDTVFGLAKTSLRYKAPRTVKVPKKVRISLKGKKKIPGGTTVIANVGRVKPKKGKRARKLGLDILTAVFQKGGGATGRTARAAGGGALKAKYKLKLKGGPWGTLRPKLDSETLELDADGWETLGAGQTEEFCGKLRLKDALVVLGAGKPGVALDKAGVLGSTRSSDALRYAFAMFCKLRGIDVPDDFFLALDAAITGAPSTPPPAPDGFFSISPNIDIDTATLIDPSFARAQFDLMQQAGVESARVVISHDSVEQKNDEFTFDNPDALIGNFAARGIETLPVIFHTSRFLSSDPLVLPVNSAEEKAEWQEYVRALVARYGPGGTYWTDVYPAQHPGGPVVPVTTWQIWNEQNLQKFVHPQPDIPKYAELLRISGEAIHSVDPNAGVAVGAMTSAGPLPPATYLEQLFQQFGLRARDRGLAGANLPFDGVSVNPYGRDIPEVGGELAEVLAVLDRYGLRSLWILIGEFGWASNPSVDSKLAKTPEEQARLLEATYGFLLRKRVPWNISAAAWYTWRESADLLEVCRWCPWAGLVDEALNEKPVFSAYQNAAAAG